METVKPREPGKKFSFNDLIAQLSQNLGVTSESLTQAFDKSSVTIKTDSAGVMSRAFFFRNEVWAVCEKKDDEGYYIIENKAGGQYRIGTTSFKQLDRETGQMIQKSMPIVIDTPMPFYSSGALPDSFESDPEKDDEDN